MFNIYSYIGRRLLLAVFVLWGVVTLLFLCSILLPINPAAAYAGNRATPAVLAAIRADLGLDKPLYVQYLDYITSLLHGNLGYSFQLQESVNTLVIQYYPATFELSVFALIFSIAIGIPLGVISATRRNKLPDHVGRVVALSGAAMPNFFLGILLLLIFYHYLGFAGIGRLPPTVTPPPTVTGLYTIDSLIAGNPKLFVESLEFLVLPALTLGYATSANISRICRVSMIEVLSSEFITAAKAKGLSQRTIIYKHALRNAIVPTTTVIGLQFGGLLAGTVIVETIFGFHGIGYTLYAAIGRDDLPVITGITLVIAINFIVINLIVDLLYLRLNPRIAYS